MKWPVRKYKPKDGDTRIRTCFAWMPTIVGEFYVWLEFYKVKEEWVEFSKSSFLPVGEWREIDRYSPTWYV